MKTRNSNLAVVSAMLAVGMFAQSVYAGPNGMDDLIRGPSVAFQQLPIQTGGPNSDTSYLNMFGQLRWQHLADDVRLNETTIIGQLRWWGFYDQDNPPLQEMFRIRFYGARAGDGLPDEANVLFEQTVDTPMRASTGRTVFVGVDPSEYLYDINFDSPVVLTADTPYWLEVIQLGDSGTAFRWEVGSTINGHAFSNPAAPNWAPSGSGELAFQLIAVPEPAACSLFFLIVAVAAMHRKRGATM